MTSNNLLEAKGLIDYIDSSPSPFHACAEAARRLEAVGFKRLEETEAWSSEPGGYYLVRAGSLIAFHLPKGGAATAPFRMIGAHSDSPNLRIKPRPNSGRAHCRQLGVETYGGVLLNSWLDRDLGLSGRVVVRTAEGQEEHLFRVDRPLLRVPQLAIHLDGDIRRTGLTLNKQTHMAPVWGLGPVDEGGFESFLAGELGVEQNDIAGWDVMCHDVQRSSLLGREQEFISAPRLDNLCSAYCGLRALEEAIAGDRPDSVLVFSLFDHEEVGSSSRSGAAGPILKDVFERIVLARGGGREEYLRALAGSFCVSADMAHATHPNYVERHEAGHHLHMNEGPVIKVNTNMRYATDAEGEAIFQRACEGADVPYQKWVNRSDLACGSTIGPITAASLGMRTVDVGTPQLAMHSAREMCGAHDPDYMLRAMAVFLRSSC